MECNVTFCFFSIIFFRKTYCSCLPWKFNITVVWWFEFCIVRTECNPVISIGVITARSNLIAFLFFPICSLCIVFPVYSNLFNHCKVNIVYTPCLFCSVTININTIISCPLCFVGISIVHKRYIFVFIKDIFSIITILIVL